MRFVKELQRVALEENQKWTFPPRGEGRWRREEERRGVEERRGGEEWRRGGEEMANCSQAALPPAAWNHSAPHRTCCQHAQTLKRTAILLLQGGIHLGHRITIRV